MITKKGVWVLVGTLCALLLLVSPAARADDGDDSRIGLYRLEGTWYGTNSDGNYTIFTFTRVGPGQYVGTSTGLFDPDPIDSGLTSEITSYSATINRIGRNRYETTWIAYFGDGNYKAAPYYGVAYAVVTNGVIEQQGPDQILATFAADLSCNPCWPYTPYFCPDNTEICTPEQPWDPFGDPATVCGETVRWNLSRRVPIDEPCRPLEEVE